jgi:hypothetical protein
MTSKSTQAMIWVRAADGRIRRKNGRAEVWVALISTSLASRPMLSAQVEK